MKMNIYDTFKLELDELLASNAPIMDIQSLYSKTMGQIKDLYNNKNNNDSLSNPSNKVLAQSVFDKVHKYTDTTKIGKHLYVYANINILLRSSR